jgi:hypothetical protein
VLRPRLAAVALPLMLASATSVPAQDAWFLTAYGARWISQGDLGGALRAELPDAEDSGLAVVALGRPVAHLGEHIRLEVEGQLGKHFGEQDHFELNGAVFARWLTFPWDERLDTSVALGEGLSYASDIPELEERTHPERGTARLLNYLAFELEVSPPAAPRWGFVARLHHRSGVFGLFDGVRGASDFFGIGLRRRF